MTTIPEPEATEPINEPIWGAFENWLEVNNLTTGNSQKAWTVFVAGWLAATEATSPTTPLMEKVQDILKLPTSLISRHDKVRVALALIADAVGDAYKIPHGERDILAPPRFSPQLLDLGGALGVTFPHPQPKLYMAVHRGEMMRKVAQEMLSYPYPTPSDTIEISVDGQAEPLTRVVVDDSIDLIDEEDNNQGGTDEHLGGNHSR